VKVKYLPSLREVDLDANRNELCYGTVTCVGGEELSF